MCAYKFIQNMLRVSNIVLHTYMRYYTHTCAAAHVYTPIPFAIVTVQPVIHLAEHHLHIHDAISMCVRYACFQYVLPMSY